MTRPGWLLPELDSGAIVVTASRRLARTLERGYGEQKLAAGAGAWTTPAIRTWGHWLRQIAVEDDDSRLILGPHQVRVLWEECLRAELDDTGVSLAALVRNALDAWSQVNACLLPLDELTRGAESLDQRIFARAAKRYVRKLETNRWLDDGLLGAAAIASVKADRIALPGAVVLTGFDRETPVQRALCRCLDERGVQVRRIAHDAGTRIPLQAQPDPAAEYRAAGHWARQKIDADPEARVAIIVPGLEQSPGRTVRLIREGFTPGWQLGGAATEAAVNISLGRSIDDYPLIAIALLVVRWLHDALSSRQLGVLLRAGVLGQEGGDARARLELELRDFAARDWTPERVLKVFTGRPGAEADTLDFLGRVETLVDEGRSLPRRAPPGRWATVFDRALTIMGWPGGRSLGSREQQLVNRWRELLNEFARLELVAGSMTLPAAAERLRAMARDTVFQPEDTGAVLDVLGPLEASGLDFDAAWITGLTASAWPAAGKATPLVARRLRRDYGLPDASPEDSLAFAATVLSRLSASAPDVRGSYPESDDDSEQSPTLIEPATAVEALDPDPGWYATSLNATRKLVEVSPESVPAVSSDEEVRGGAATLDQQLSEPFSAFAGGRLGVRRIGTFAEGLTPLLRGNLVHDALRRLYEDCPDQAAIARWTKEELDARSGEAARAAVARYRVAAGATLERLLDFEEQRTATLLRSVVAVDLLRPAFAVASVEGTSSGAIGGLKLNLRHDRIDRLPDGSVVVLDYKTGSRKKFFEKGEPTTYQLMVYAATLSRSVSDLGLYNVDSREVVIDGAGRHLSGDEAFGNTLAGWIGEVERGAIMLMRGDVRVNVRQGSTDARPLALLSRYAELIRHG